MDKETFEAVFLRLPELRLARDHGEVASLFWTRQLIDAVEYQASKAATAQKDRDTARTAYTALLLDLRLSRVELLDPKLHKSGCRFRVRFTHDVDLCDCGLFESGRAAAARIELLLKEGA